jgi:hypothetical protein
VLLYLLFESPVKMVVAGGISQSVMAAVTAYSLAALALGR